MKSKTPCGLAVFAMLAVLLTCISLQADPVFHKFQLWGTIKDDPSQKLLFYLGWTNGFLVARGLGGPGLAKCLGSDLSTDQAIAMIDKQYDNHPENWSRPITEQILQALTSEGPCMGKNPLPKGIWPLN